jgi:transglutaminase-like putative cysteine protease
MFLTKGRFPVFMALAILFSAPMVFGQKKSKNPTDEEFPPPVKFGVVTPDDFKSDLYAFDTAAPAVIIFDKGYSYFKESKEGWFQLIFEKKQRIKIVNKNGMDAANFVISQYKNGKAEEKIDKLVAVTYNLENDKVIETPLNPSDIYKDQMSKNVNYLKFGLPAVKEGSIIEVSYTVISDFLFNLRSWNFQGEYPRVHSEYTTRIPDFFVYAGFKDGYLPFTHSSSNKAFKSFTILIPGKTAYESNERISLSTNETETRMVMQNVPAFKPEKFITTTSNYMSRVRYQLSEYRFPNQDPRPVMSTWPKLAEELLKDEEFGAAFAKNNSWLQEDLKKITNEASTDLEKAKAIYNYWRTNFTLTSEGGKYMTDNPKNIWKNRKGNTADGNLMLTLLLKTAGLKADPFILSTRDNGWANDFYPLINEYNYVVSKLTVDEKVYYLDATQPLLGFGFLPLECYNGHGRAITAMPLAEYLNADNVLESKNTYITMFNSEENPWKVNVVPPSWIL